MQIQKDKSANSYIESDHTRVTLVYNRPNAGKDWSGGTTLRIQAKRGDGSLHMGAEIPLEDIKEVAAGLVALLAGQE